MPRVAEAAGIVISIYAADHRPPHVHVYYAEDAALVAIASSEVLDGFVPARQLRKAMRWIAEHRDELRVKWADLNP